MGKSAGHAMAMPLLKDNALKLRETQGKIKTVYIFEGGFGCTNKLERCSIWVCFVAKKVEPYLVPTHVSPLVRKLVRPSVRDTFEFPLPLNISVQQSSLITCLYPKKEV